MTTFPDVPAFTGFNTPSRVEANVHDLNVTGTIPAEMDGAFYRVQPEHQFPPLLGNDIAFNGDGMISMFRFKDGKVDYEHIYWDQASVLVQIGVLKPEGLPVVGAENARKILALRDA